MDDDEVLLLERGSDEWKGCQVDRCSLNPNTFVLCRAETRK